MVLVLGGAGAWQQTSPVRPPGTKQKREARSRAISTRAGEDAASTRTTTSQQVPTTTAGLRSTQAAQATRTSTLPLALSRLEALPKQTVWSEFGALAAEMGDACANLGQGFPDWAPPSFATDALLDVAKDGPVSAHHYARPVGLPALCEVLARRYSRHLDRPVDASTEVAVTVGATQALLVALMTLIRVTGDEVVFLEPCFDLYWGQVRLAGGRPSPCAMRLRSDRTSGVRLELDAEALAESLKTARVLVLNSPHNPSGKVFTRKELEQAAALVRAENARRMPGDEVFVISDEVYKYIVHDPAHGEHVHVGTLEGLRDVTLTVSSAGKTFSATGWQIGWIVGPPKILAHAHRLLPYLQFCAATPVQTAVAKALDAADAPYHGRPSYYDWLSVEYARKRDVLTNALKDADLPVLPAAGGFFLLVDIKAYVDVIPPRYFLDPAAGDFEGGLLDPAPASADWAFCRWLARDLGVVAIPASPFFDAGAPRADIPRGIRNRLVRFAFCKSDDVLHKASRRLRRLPDFLRRAALPPTSS